MSSMRRHSPVATAIGEKFDGSCAPIFQMNKEQIRAYIKLRTALSMQPKSIRDELCTALGEEAPAYSTVKKWSRWFLEGREEV